MNTQLTAKQIQNHFATIADPKRALLSQKFFKTGKGEYSEHDIFIGITVPQLREIAKTFKDLPLAELQTLISSEIHEERLIALHILVIQYKKGNNHVKDAIYLFYLSNLEHINNWDLVDSSAHLIVGAHSKNSDLMVELTKSSNLWKRRIAIIATWHFIKKNDFAYTIDMAKRLLEDPHDLIHKAVGWMLRELGKRNTEELEQFLNKHASTMPRTMLRYALEKLPEEKRQFYLHAKKRINT